MKKEALIWLVLLLLLAQTALAGHLKNIPPQEIDVRYAELDHLELNHLIYNDNLERISDLGFVRQEILVQALQQKFGIITSQLKTKSTLKQTDTVLESASFTVANDNSAFVFQNPAALDESEQLIQVQAGSGSSFEIVFGQENIMISVSGAEAFIGTSEGFVMSISNLNAQRATLVLQKTGLTQSVTATNAVLNSEGSIFEGDSSFERNLEQQIIPQPEIAQNITLQQNITPEQNITAPAPIPEQVSVPKPQRPDQILTDEEFVIETLLLELSLEQVPQTLIDERIERLRNTLEHVQLEREIIRSEGKTIVRITMTPDSGFFRRTLAENYTLYDRIPKCFGSLAEIVFDRPPTKILDEDPAYKYSFGDLDAQTTYSYYTNSRVPEECDQFFAAIGISDNIKNLGLTDTIALKGLGSAIAEFWKELILFALLIAVFVAVGKMVAMAKRESR